MITTDHRERRGCQPGQACLSLEFNRKPKQTEASSVERTPNCSLLLLGDPFAKPRVARVAELGYFVGVIFLKWPSNGLQISLARSA